MSSRAATRDLGSPDPGQFSYGLFTILLGVWVGGRPPDRPCFWCPTHQTLRRRVNQGDTQDRPRQHCGTSCGCANAQHSPRAVAMSLSRPQCEWTILQRGGPSLTTHPRYQGNAQAFYTLGRLLHHDGGHQTSDLSPPVDWQSWRSKRLKHQALTSLLSLEDVYQIKSYVLSSFVSFI
jgi:hypothetical protein